MPDSEELLHNKAEHHTEISGGSGHPGWGPDDHHVAPGDGGEGCHRGPRQEQISDPGDGAEPGPILWGPEPEPDWPVWPKGDLLKQNDLHLILYLCMHLGLKWNYFSISPKQWNFVKLQICIGQSQAILFKVLQGF